MTRVKPALATLAVCITPFDAEGRLDEGQLRAHLARMGAAGVGVYVGGGGPGEGYSMSFEEGQRVLEIAVSELGGRVPVRARGLEPRTAGEMIRYVDAAAAKGVDATVVSSLDAGHGYRLDPGEVEMYFNTVLAAASAPVVISVHPAVGYPIPAPLVHSLAHRFDCVVGIDCALPDLVYLQQLIGLIDGEVEVRSGGPPLALANLALGGHGFVSQEANIAPRLAASLIRRFLEADPTGTHEAWRQLMRMWGLISRFGSARVVKAALVSLGLPGGSLRPPRQPLPAAAVADVEKVLADLEIRSGEFA